MNIYKRPPVDGELAARRRAAFCSNEGWRAAKDILNTAHALIAGTTGSGKSVALNSLMAEALATRPDSQWAFIDLKELELDSYRRLPTCIGYAVTEDETIALLEKCIQTMKQRNHDTKVRLHARETDKPHLYIVIDELADLADNKEVLGRLITIGRLGRAAHIHIIAATQDPSRRTLKAQLMQNFSLTVALRCRSSIESRQIIGQPGAERLPRYGHGYMWDYRGVRPITIPKTPDEVLEAMIGSIPSPKRSLWQSFLEGFRQGYAMG